MISQLLIPSLLLLPVPGLAEAPVPAVGAPEAPVSLLLEEGEEAEGPKWTGTVNFGLTFTDGNTETLNAAAGFDAKRRAEKDRWTAKAFWNYAEQEINKKSEITQRNLGGSLKYDYFATEKLYYLGVAGAESDEFANLDLRYNAGAGAGYQFREDDKMNLSGEAGLNYFAEEYESGTDADYIAARVAYDYENHLRETVVVAQTAEIFQGLEDIEDFYSKLDTRCRVTLTESMFAQLQWVMDYDNSPAPYAYRMDHRVILSLGWSF